MSKLRIGVHYEPSNIDPHLGAAELALQMTNACFDTLVHKTAQGDYLPGLALSWTVSDDQCRYEFILREDVVFHDGTPFDGAAVKASFDRAQDPAQKSQLAGGLLGSYRDTILHTPHRIEVVLDRPYALFLDALSQGWLAPMSPKAMAANGPGFMAHPVGTGPFVFDHWEKGSHLTIRRFGDYAWWPELIDAPATGADLVDEIEYHFLPSDAERTRALTEGRVDMILAADPAACADLRADGRFEVLTCPIRGVPVSFMMNIHKTPTDSLMVRRAISHALDIDGIVAQVFRGEFKRAHSPVSQDTIGYASEVEGMYPHDPDRARALLDADGWLPDATGQRHRGDQPLEVVFYALPVNFYPEFGALVRDQLAAVGVSVRVELVSPPEWIAAGMAGDHNIIPQGKYASSSQLLGFVYHSRNSGPGAYGWSKRGPEDAPRIDALIDAAETCIAPADYVPLFAEVQKEVMKNALAVPLHCNTNLIVARHGVTGLSFDAIGAYPLFHATAFTPKES